MKNPIFPILAAMTAASPLLAESSSEVEALRAQVEALAKSVGALQKQLRKQEQRWDHFNAPASTALTPMEEAHDHSGHEAPPHDHSSDHSGHAHSAPEKKGGFNPAIFAAVDFVTSYSQAANQWNFTLQNVEITLKSDIDQFARGTVTIAAHSELTPTHNHGLFEHASIAVEEASIETTRLPFGLQLRAGQFFADFTRLGKIHTHDLPFVDRPNSLASIIGNETIARGLELNWAPPTPHYFRLTAGLVDHIGEEPSITSLIAGGDDDAHGHGHGESAFEDANNRSFKSLMAYTRGATLFELREGTLLRLGADYAQSSRKNQRQIASADAKLEWQPDPAKFDLLEIGAETLWTEQSGTLSKEAAHHGPASGSASAYGGYAYAQYRIGKQWQPGVRVDYLRSNTFQHSEDEPQKLLAKTWTYSAYVSYSLSENNRLRLQLNYVHGSDEIVSGKGRTDVQAFFQWTFLFGPHTHHLAP